MLLSKAIEGFTLSKSADGLSPDTLDIYNWALQKLVTFLQDKEVENITEADCRAWMSWLRDEYEPASNRSIGKNLSLSSLQDAHTALKSFYSWASKELGIPRVDTVKRPSGEKPVIRVLSEDEVRALLKVAEYTPVRKTAKRNGFIQKRPTAERNVALVMFLVDTGLRVGELSRMKVGDVDQETGEVRVAPFRSGRKSKPRFVYLGKAARRVLWKYLAKRGETIPEDPLFMTDDDRPMTRDGMVLVIRRLGKRAGIKECHPHTLRHTFATQFIRNGGDAFALQRALGHSDFEMVRRYVETAQSDVEAAFRKASPADRWRL